MANQVSKNRMYIQLGSVVEHDQCGRFTQGRRKSNGLLRAYGDVG